MSDIIEERLGATMTRFGHVALRPANTVAAQDQVERPNGYRTCCTECSTSSKPQASTNGSSSDPRRTCSTQND
ncbi:hypothetical protein [Dietzia cinnamea]|uniref:hypothetical protein n=1 Tax=Dietzia cinnamea TaxID=321318 RepID=UPI001045C38F|nr:hypothetical protein [Dietzia cinnamea]MCT2275723.1 hypothetical protein [Dietzia cinnamea]